MSTRPRSIHVALLLFCSGFCALIYQTVWLREFRLIFGASTAASAAVLGIFMGGLGLGSAFLGKRAETSRKPLMMYGNLELWIAVFAALSPALLWMVRSLYASTGGTMVLGTFFGTFVRLVMAGVVLIGPTYLMGGTLPAAVRSIASESDQSRRSLALLYGANTMGAVTGTLLSTFWLVELVGNRTALWLGCILNVAVALVARIISHQCGESAAKADSVDVEVEASNSTADGRLVIVAAGIVGFAFMLMELVWYRMLGPILGGSTFTFGLILAVALLGIGLGGLAYALRGASRPVTLNGFALTCALEALFIVAPYALGDRLAVSALVMRNFGSLGFAAQALGWTAIAAIVVLPAAVVAGYQFPMLIALLGQGRSGVARQTGVAYAANTLGAIIGSLAGGFGFMPLFTAPGLWKAVTVLLVLLAATAALWSRRRTGALAWAPIAVSCAALVLFLCPGPTAVWRHGGIGAGRADGRFSNVNGMVHWTHWTERNTIWEAEGIESSVALGASSGLAFVVNGKVDGNARSDSGTQVMSGILPAMLHPAPRKVLIVGLGTGSTAGWLASLPEIERVDVMELEPAILEVARRCAPVNNHVLENPKVHIHLGDAREALITTPERYDIIFSEPSNPYRAGIASLFTLDFYRSAKQRLAPGGIFAQWVQAYEIRNDTLQTVIGTVGSAFGNVQTWRTQATDIILLASDHEITIDADRLRERASDAAIKRALFSVWRVSTAEGILSHFVANENFARKIVASEPDIATDDRNPLEYGFARGIGKRKDVSVPQQMAEYSLREKFNRPLSVSGAVQWDRVDGLNAVSETVDGAVPEAISLESASRKAWRQFCTSYVHQDFPGALRIARELKLEAIDPMQVEMMAECAVFAGDPAAAEWIEKYAAIYPNGAVALRACAAASRSEWESAADGFVAAFTAFQSDPWVRPNSLAKLLNTAQFVAYGSRSPKIARRLFDALDKPFSVELAREERLFTRLAISRVTDGKPLNAQYLEALSPYAQHPVWTREFLTDRLNAYLSAKDPQIEAAAADLHLFLENESLSFDATLKSPRAAASPSSSPAPAAPAATASAK